MTLDELIAALEKATGPDRELDVAIHLEATKDRENIASKIIRSEVTVEKWEIGYGGIYWQTKSGSGNWPIKFYTSSIDAAMTLVPKGWLLSEFGQNHPEFKSVADREWFAGVMGPVSWAPPEPGAPDEPVYDHANGTHDIHAIALCIAALRARKEGENDV